jgi:hypothetical protein
MHGYAGDPTNYPAEVELIDDSDAPNATNFGTTSEGTLDRTAWLRVRIAAGPAVDWKPSFVATAGPGGADFGAACYDYDNNWILVTFHQGSMQWDAFQGQGLDAGAAAAWRQLGATQTMTYAAVSDAAVSPDPSSTGQYWVFTHEHNPSGNPYNFTAYQFASGSWTVKRTFQCNPGTIGKLSCVAFNGSIIYALAAQNVAGAGFSSSSDSGSTWHDFSAGLPNMPNGSEWLLKTTVDPLGVPASGDHVLAVPAFAALGAATPVWKSTNGAAWTQSATLSGLPSGASIVGLSWCNDGLGPCWILMVQTGVFATTILRSPDGVTWTTQLGSAPTADIADMGSLAPVSPGTVGPTLVCTLADESTPGGSGQILSIDGGQNWYPSEARLFGNDTGSTGYTRSRVVASGNGFFTYNSLWARFSALFGLPF